MTKTSGSIAFADEWIESWNSHDLNRILSHYSPDIVLLSPIAQRRVGDGRVVGLDSLRSYWKEAIGSEPNLAFKLIETLIGHSSLTIIYRNHRDQRAAETFEFGADGKVIRSIACYL